ncbi:Putative hypothetical protein [Helicobacter mustelae 12198]|uniref:Septum formation initiator n=1 Tax=Helicobacter mustelae (strain ATCC 43772 / CCUG 25715 / CIP 103759 / LMG 18044 / NCTC 12198 / R85-136P) TaxID=679897 RepID=D3UG26_HELM1|nr:Putative hypothetical protein [Helicobacter mustelae 12198]
MRFLRALYHRRVFLIYFVGIIIFCSYLFSITINGKYSMRVLLENKSLESELKNKIRILKNENANLRKQLFEIKGLEP